MNQSDEWIILKWSMDEESWSHWAQGRGRKTVREVILEGINEIRTSQEARHRVRRQCRRTSDVLLAPPEQGAESRKHKIEIHLSASDWGEACQLVGECGSLYRTKELLAALILESSGWKQVGEAEFRSGYKAPKLTASLDASTSLTYAPGLRLSTQERVVAWIIAGATILNAVAAWAN